MQTIPEETMLELELSRQIHAACIWEATARKIGNVHPLASFRNLHFTDFILSAGAIAPILCKTRKLGLGNAIFESVKTTCQHQKFKNSKTQRFKNSKIQKLQSMIAAYR